VTRRRWPALVSVLGIALLSVAALEVAARSFWRIEFQLSFRRPSHPLYAFYPELKFVDAAPPRHDDGFYDVLLLGESVLHHAWGEIEPALQEQLALAGQPNVRIFNLAVPAQTTRDSWLKYAALGAARFDLVMLYHGANEARTNNAPPEMFREDYSHYSWYAMVNALAPSHGTAVFALAYTLRYAAARARQRWAPDRYVPTNEPRAEWVEYGRKVRSVASFEHNVAAILALASERGDPVMLMTFATHVPANYSREAFVEKRLDYRLHKMPVETWGRREYVMAAVAAHNDVVRRLASEHKEVLFVDQAALMEGSARNFDDPFHLTIEGSVAFVEHVISVLRPHLPRVEAGNGGDARRAPAKE